ncbi:MAG: hypothetical protein C0594_04435 [Marinilabiliales bacterium]|nr:MAG: hypothetical protein C0594_04435 [Marinilabiliales bacterium]
MKRILYFISFTTIIALGGCKKQFSDQPYTKVIGHGGAGYDMWYPPNTAQAIYKGFEQGADGFEIDVQLSSDHHLVAFHDSYLTAKTDANQYIYELDSNEISKIVIDYYNFGKFKITFIDNLLKGLKQDGSPIFLDCKINYPPELSYEDYIELFSSQIVKLITKYPEYKFITETRNIHFLRKVKTKLPNAIIFYNPPDYEDGIQTVSDNNFQGLSISSELITAEQVKNAQSAGIEISLFGCSSKIKNRKALAKAPDYIQTDKVKHLRSLL